ncbi:MULTISPECIES: DUF1120 domain-containing protein [unclassified Enterobacter cloacae complex]|uniref:DUF1120 domain-containing protein n=1 Tax=unclassified Enterobacter cloacae complex TaxID=2757714 RepID=UPI001872AFC7|nr:MULTISPECIES: DUF1120 domain-containing protein [unclassified Enterobacter cloacae complex]MBE4810062.1 DUF1120 domain-containing protein [Enterobacter cloacae complex sp. P44RS]MBE4827954.1 DUF1120 domain-containing protein [Enterobacter cloacae complex sp. P42RS]MBE4836260.1 DUF1120 domain-containing protein [Enterobacter cloacae complex sp. P46RS]MBE4839839.1 DUF1120 domain-containing protein [Enterobacter cloacae complex sp. P42C]
MLNNFIKTALAAALLVSGINAASAESVQVNVIGTIVPAACTPTVSGGGIIDYGNIKASTLSADAYTVLPVKSVDFAINCDAPARVAISAINDRPGSMAGVTESSIGTALTPVGVFGYRANYFAGAGLGLDGTKRIGGYAIQVAPSTVTVDGNKVDSIEVNNGRGEGPWHASDGAPYNAAYLRSISWAETGSLTPVAFKTLAGTLNVQAYLNKASELDLSHAVKLDGQTTLEVVYL